VQDVNEQPSAGADQVVSAAENVNTTTVLATVAGSDPDFGGGNDGSNNFENLSYAIVAGNAAGLFEINSAGQISLQSGDQLNFETAQQHVLTVRVTDGPGLFDEVQVTINVTDVNELVVNPENLITNFGTNVAFTVPEWAFLANDFDPEGNPIDISGASSVTGLSVSHTGGTGTNGTVNVTDTGGSGGTLQYTVTDGTLSSSVNIAVTQDSNSISGTSSDDILVGDNDGDTFNGNGGNDVILAGGGNDTLVGGAGRDIMVGGSGNDTFDFNSTSESGNTIATADVITDFVHGQDRIDLSSIDANTGSGGNQAFTWGGTTATANGVWYSESGGNTVISIDTNGNTASVEMMIVLTGISLNLAATDFTL
jgi:Ca2+-binding RTX toxin-like protein